MWTQQCLLIVVALSGYVHGDECIDYVEWTNLEDRSIDVEVKDHSKALCDRYINPSRWYRPISQLGNMMPTSCVKDPYRCSTHYPLWLNGTYPTTDKKVKRTACIVDYHSENNVDCCALSVDIEIKKCDGFYVYKLAQTPGCNMAYCFGLGTLCEDGQTPSVDGCEDPLKDKCRSVSLELKPTATDIEFVCKFRYELHDSFKARIEWYIGDNYVKHENFDLKSTQNKPIQGESILKQQSLKEHGLGKMVKCIGKTEMTAQSAISAGKQSQEIFAGIEILTTRVTVSESVSAEIELNLTIPYLCNDVKCGFNLETRVPKDFTEEECLIGEPTIKDFVVSQNCGITILPANQSDVHKVTIKGVGDYKFNKGDLTRSFHLYTDKNHLPNKLWSDYFIGRVEVTVIPDTTVQSTQCSSTNEPYIRRFDEWFDRYSLQSAGEFLMYAHKQLPIRVHVFTQSCTFVYGNGYCNCGVAIKAGRDSIVIDKCRNSRSIPFRLSTYGCEELGRGISVYEENGENYEVVLTTGAKVNVRNILDGFRSSITITPSHHDFGMTEGLCGVWNNNPNDDEINSVEQWRVPRNESFYDGASPFGEPLIGFSYCSCGNTSKQPECGIAPYKLCKNKTTDITDNLANACNRRKRRDLEALDDEDEEELVFLYDVIPFVQPTWPTPSGWTEEKATRHCINKIQNSEIGQACNEGIPDVSTDESVWECINDILQSDSTSFVEGAFVNFVDSCVDMATRNVSLWEEREIQVVNTTADNGTMIAKKVKRPPLYIMNKACPKNCSGHGICSEGYCECEAGFLGVDCFQRESEAPHIVGLIREGLCNADYRPCATVTVYGERFINSQNLTCHLQPLHIDSSGLLLKGEILESRAIYEYSGLVRCVLPPNTEITQRVVFYEAFNLTVSNNGIDVGEEFFFARYSENCATCNATLRTCEEKENRVKELCEPPETTKLPVETPKTRKPKSSGAVKVPLDGSIIILMSFVVMFLCGCPME